ncbi:MAG: chromo domain-containing protein, partial [Aeromonas sp.]
ISPSFHVSLLKPHTDSLSPSYTGPGGVDQPPPEITADESIYRVQEILDSRRRGPHLQYLVDWEGFGPEGSVHG